MAPDTASPSALLLDLQGVLVEDQRALPGADDTVNLASRRGVAIRFVTNTATRHHDDLLPDLQQQGLAAAPSELASASLAARSWLVREQRRPWPWCIRRSRPYSPSALASRWIAFCWGMGVIC